MDLADVGRFGGAAYRPGSAFHRRVFTPCERASYAVDPVGLALGWSAKEAIGKMLGQGLTLDGDGAVRCQDLDIAVDGAMQPCLRLSGSALAAASDCGLATLVLDWGYDTRNAWSVALGSDDLGDDLRQTLRVLAAGFRGRRGAA